MKSATPQVSVQRIAEESGPVGAPGVPHAPGRVLRTAAVDGELSVSHLMSRASEWLVVHRADCTPESLADRGSDDFAPRTVHVVVVAATPDEQDRLLHDLPGHIAAAIRGSPPPARPPVIEVQELHIDRDAHRVTVRGEEVSLTRLEFLLLLALVARRERVQSRGVLLREVWRSSESTQTRTVDTHVKRLRGKLRSAGRFIQSVRGVGYCFSEAPRTPRSPAWAEIQVHAKEGQVGSKRTAVDVQHAHDRTNARAGSA